MQDEKILEIVLREMQAIGRGWRADWSDFDGRQLRDQLGCLAAWAERAKTSQEFIDYTDGTEFEKAQSGL